MLLTGKTVFVTGANGFVGSFLVERLLQEGAAVKCLVRNTGNLRWLKTLKVEYIFGDITDIKSLEGGLKDVDYVFHIAALKHSSKEEEYRKVNICGTENLLKTVKKEALNLKKFIFLSSMAAMGYSSREKTLCEQDECRPLTYYGKSKLMAEKTVLEFKNDFPVTILRPPAVYGPKDEDIYAMFRTVKMGIRPVFGLGKKHISMIYVFDLVEAMLLAALSLAAEGKVYIIAEDRSYSWKEIQDVLAATLKVKAFTVKIPETVLFTAGFLAELFSKATGSGLLLTRQKVKEMTGDWVCDISLAKKDLFFKPAYSMEKGMIETVKWYKENKWL